MEALSPRRIPAILLALCIGIALALPARAELAISPSVKNQAIEAGQAGQVVYVTAFNSGSAVKADVYYVIQAPGGSFYSWRNSGWQPGLTPWFRGVNLPASFSYPNTPVTTLPALGGGLYTVYAAFARPGTLDLLQLGETQFFVSGRAGGGGTHIGAVFLSETRTVRPGVPVETSTEAGATFIRSNKSLEQTRQLLNGPEPGTDSCVFSEVSGNLFSPPSGFEITTEDIGEAITMSAARRGRTEGSIKLPRDLDVAAQGYTIYGLPRGVKLPAGVVSRERLYTFSAPGGAQLSGFSASIQGIDPLVLVNPDLTRLRSIRTSTDLPLAWNGNRGVGNVVASLVSTTLSFPPKVCTVSCLFRDDGNGSVPAALLKQLKSCAGEGGGGFPDIPGLPDLPDLPPGLGGLGGSTVSFSMNRHKMQFFNTQRNELQFGMLLLDAGVQAPDVTLD